MLKRAEAGVLSVAYIENGPSSGLPVLLLHGFPYDVHSFPIPGLSGLSGHHTLSARLWPNALSIRGHPAFRSTGGLGS